MSTEPLTPEEVDRYRLIIEGRKGHIESRDWADRDIAALLATLDAARAAQDVAGRETLFPPLPPVPPEAWAERLDDWPVQPVTPPPDAAGRERMTFGPECGPFDHPVGCQCPYPLVAAERDRIAALLVTPPPDVLREDSEGVMSEVEAAWLDFLVDDGLSKSYNKRVATFARHRPRIEAALRAQGVVQSPETLEARRLLGYLWTATGKNHLRPVRDLFAEDDPIVADIERLAIFPVDESRDPEGRA